MGVKGCFKFFFRRAIELIVLSVFIIYFPYFPPDASISESYRLPPFKPLTGKLAVNNRLDEVEVWHKGDLHGPESIIDHEGELYTSLVDGDIVKLVGKDHIVPVIKFGKPCSEVYEEKLCGRPLGFQFGKDGYLYAADAYYGIWKADVKTGKKERLVSPNEKIDGKVPKLFNSIAIASNGDIYFSHSSSQFDLQNGLFDILSDPSGRLIRYDPKTKTKTVLIDKLAFGNGVILSDDEEFVLVAETLKSRILRYYLKGPKKGTYDIFADGLPGVTDNLKSDGKGGFLAALPMAVDEDHPFIAQVIAPFPFIRKLVVRLGGITEWIFETVDRYYPNELSKKMVFYIGHFASIPDVFSNKRVTVLRLSKNGEVIDSIHTIGRNLGHFCEAHIFKDTLYLASYRNDYIGKIPLSKIGWEDLRTDNREKRQTKPVDTVKREVPVAQEQKAAPTQAPKVQTTTPLPPKKEPEAKKETVPPQKQAPPPVKATTPPPPKATTPPPPKVTNPPTPKVTNPPPPKATTPPPVKKETATPKPSNQQTQPPKQQEPSKQAPPPQKAQTQPPKQEKEEPNRQQQTATPKPQVKQTPPPQKVEPKKEQPTTQKPQTVPPKQQAVPAQKVDSKPQQAQPAAQTTQQKAQAATPKLQATQKQQATTQNPKESNQKPQNTPQKESPNQAPPSRKPPPVAQPVKQQANSVPVNDGSKK